MGHRFPVTSMSPREAGTLCAKRSGSQLAPPETSVCWLRMKRAIMPVRIGSTIIADPSSKAELIEMNCDSRWRLSREQTRDLAVGITVLLLASTAGWVFRGYAHDDAFITYRYARNIALGRGFVYNPGEHVLGTSTPLFTLLLAAVHRFTGIEVHVLSNLLGVACLAAASLFFYRLGSSNHIRSALIATVLFVTNPILIASLGMETLPLLCTIMAALTAYLSGTRALTAVLLGAMVLLRYEMVIFVALIGFADWLETGRVPSWLWPAAAILAAWLTYAWLEFGQILPQSAVAKIAAYRLPFLLGGLVIWDIYARQLPAYYLLLILAILGAYSVVRTRTRRLSRGYRLLLTWGGLYLLAAALVAGSFPWYYAPLVPGLAILVGVGASISIEILSKQLVASRDQRTGGRPAAGAVILIVLLLGLGGLNVAAWTRAWVVGPESVIDARVLTYRKFAEWLSQNAPPGSTLASFEIGAIGYYTDMYMIDLSGLITPEILPYVGNRDRAERMRSAILRYRPDYALVPLDLVESFHYPGHDILPVHSADGLELYSTPE